MKTKKKAFLLLALLLLAVSAAGIWYARPLTIEEMFPSLDLEQCVGVQVNYWRYPEERSQLMLEGDSLSPLLELFQGQKFQRSPFFWSARGYQVYPWREGDFRWSVEFAYKDVPVTDDSIASGYLLCFDKSGEKLKMRSAGTTWRVRTADQEQWMADVMACLEAAEPSTDAEFQKTLYN